MNKKILIFIVLSILIAVTLGMSTVAVQAAEGKEIRIGIVGPMTGWAYVYGQYVVQGVKLALEEHNLKFRDRPIKLYIEDTKGETELTIEKFSSLKERDRVHVIIGPSLGNEGMGMADWAARNPDMPILVGYSAPEDITMRKHSRNILRPGWTGSQDIFYFGEFCAKMLGYKKIVMVGQDYSYPWDQAAGFIRGFLENGGEEFKRIWHPVELLDFGSIMLQLQKLSKDYDAVLYNGGGAQVVAFFKQWNQYGMDKFYPQLLGGANIADRSILPELGHKAAGIYSSMHYCEGLQTKENLEFREKFYNRWERYPGAIEVQGYDAMKVIFKALEAVDGDIEDTDAFIEVLYKVEMPESPRGPWYFDEFGQAVQNIYIQKVVRIADELLNVPVKTYIKVSQFGPYTGMEKEYMSQPPNGHSYPPETRDEYMKEIEKYLGKEYVETLKENKGWKY